MIGLEDRYALVTGASRGIGAAIARTLADCGCHVAVHAVTRRAQAEELAGEIRRSGRQAQVAQADIADRAQVESMVDRVIAGFGRLDILVNNAAIIRRGDFLAHEPEEWERVLRVNLWGAFYTIRAALPQMIAQGSGKIINVSSIAGKIGDLTAAPSYGASKGALNALTKSIAREVAPLGITVNAVAPHAIATEMSAEWSDEKRRQITAAIPMKRLGTPQEVAQTVAFLASDGANFITGEVININGGYLMD